MSEENQSFKFACRAFSIYNGIIYLEKSLRLIKISIAEKYSLDPDSERVLNAIAMATDEYDESETLAEETSALEQLMYESFVVSVFIFIEAQVIELCTHVRKIKNETTDIKGHKRGLKWFIADLKNHSVDFPPKKIHDDFYLALDRRNALVHNSGILNGKKVNISYEYAFSLIALSRSVCDDILKQFK